MVEWYPKVETREQAWERLGKEGRREEFMEELREKAPVSKDKLIPNLHMRVARDLFYEVLTDYSPVPWTPKEPEQPEPDPHIDQNWKRYGLNISQLEAGKQLVIGANRKVSYYDEIEWVRDNLDNPAATPKKAPSNGAWSTLLTAKENLVQRSKFLNDVYKQAMLKNKEEGESKRVMEDDKRKQFKLIEDLKRKD